ncbi:DUF2061 domain-containing protein [Marinihelvus fidelis]|uniref:DUF2061 domain-containing protein n=1 Tax=Marinihelvus fidelis TaxID=2613842 RepID=A0A5N0TCM5_9GAMM|nr:DUF2061 domain-containing protein [Marinihelvus fidelis]KAA9132755.1 DUF2061 domain-containing protein [Marinihelvus fidelis]
MHTTLKTATFAVTHFSVAFVVAWLLTGSLVIGGLVALVEPAVNTVAYAIHEKLWSRVRPSPPPKSTGFSVNAG